MCILTILLHFLVSNWDISSFIISIRHSRESGNPVFSGTSGFPLSREWRKVQKYSILNGFFIFTQRGRGVLWICFCCIIVTIWSLIYKLFLYITEYTTDPYINWFLHTKKSLSSDVKSLVIKRWEECFHTASGYSTKCRKTIKS